MLIYPKLLQNSSAIYFNIQNNRLIWYVSQIKWKAIIRLLDLVLAKIVKNLLENQKNQKIKNCLSLKN